MAIVYDPFIIIKVWVKIITIKKLIKITVYITDPNSIKCFIKRARTNTLVSYTMPFNISFVLVLVFNLVFMPKINNFSIDNVYYY